MLNKIDKLNQAPNRGTLSPDGAWVFSGCAVLFGATLDVGVFYLLTGSGVALGAANMVSFLTAAVLFYVIKARNTPLKAYVTVILMALFLRGFHPDLGLVGLDGHSDCRLRVIPDRLFGPCPFRLFPRNERSFVN